MKRPSRYFILRTLFFSLSITAILTRRAQFLKIISYFYFREYYNTRSPTLARYSASTAQPTRRRCRGRRCEEPRAVLYESLAAKTLTVVGLSAIFLCKHRVVENYLVTRNSFRPSISRTKKFLKNFPKKSQWRILVLLRFGLTRTSAAFYSVTARETSVRRFDK